MQNFNKILLFLALSTLVGGCLHTKNDPSDPQAAYSEAVEAYQDKNYQMALMKLREFKSRFPYSSFATKAELQIADCHFQLEQFAEASVVYAEFIKLHPKHSEVDFAQFRIGMSHWNLSPEGSDRDQEFTEKAVNEFKELIKNFPQSKYLPDSKTNLASGEKKLAESLDMIGAYYCKQEIWHACAQRSMDLVEAWPQFRHLVKKASHRAAQSFDRLADLKESNPQSDTNYFYKSMTASELRSKAKFFASAADKL